MTAEEFINSLPDQVFIDNVTIGPMSDSPNWAEHVDAMRQRYIDQLSWFDNKDFSNMTLADLDAGQGITTEYFRTKFKSVVAFESIAEYHEMARARFPEIDIRHGSFDNKNYDMIVMIAPWGPTLFNSLVVNPNYLEDNCSVMIVDARESRFHAMNHQFWYRVVHSKIYPSLNQQRRFVVVQNRPLDIRVDI